MRYAVTNSEGDEYFAVSDAGDGRVCVTIGDPDEFVCLTQEQWRGAVEATRSLWEKEHRSITKMREDMEAKRARGEHVPVEIAHFLKTHPA